jgi:RNA polymerase sigma factor (sigma-70 family)
MDTLPVSEPRLDRSRLEELYVRFIPAARATAYLMTGDRAMAEDLAHEAFLRATGRFAHLREPETFEAYLRKTVTTVSLNHLRRRKLERTKGAPQMPAPALMPDVARAQDLWRSLHTLPPRQRAALVLRYYEDLSERQAAEILRCSRTAVRSLVAHGLKSLRDRIREDPDG